MGIKDWDDDHLENTLVRLTTEERHITARVLDHLREVEERRLFAKRGYSSLFCYCTEFLRYSEGAASRRISSMRLLKECPDLKKEVAEGTLSLSNVAKAASFFRQEQKMNKTYSKVEKNQILSSLSGKSQKEAEKSFIGLSPKNAKMKEHQRAISCELTELKLTMDKETTKKLERLRQLKPELGLNDLLSWMLTRCLKQIDPLNKPINKSPNNPSNKPSNKPSNRSLNKPASGASHTAVSEPIEKADSLPQRNQGMIKDRSSKEIKPLRKTLTRKKRREVWQRAKGRCQYVDPQSGRICQALSGLELDHIRPLILGGDDKTDNLRLLCRNHHRLATLVSFGSAAVGVRCVNTNARSAAIKTQQ